MNCHAAKTHRRRHPAKRPQGFTLIELLVVIGIVGILAGLILPVLAKGKGKAQAAICSNNHRQLILSWLLYSGDYDDALAYNLGDEDIKRAVAAGQYPNWVNNVMSWELDSDNTNAALLTLGGLGPYCGGAVSIYRCPADSVVSDIQRAAGWTRRTRSISMNAMVGDAGSFTGGGTNVNVPGYRQFFRMSQFSRPSDMFVFTEEHPDSINDGYFLNNPASGEWTDLPASWHETAGHLAFADGHIELHRWVSPSTRPPNRPDGAQLPFAVPAGEEADYDWMMARMSYGRRRYAR